MNAAKPALGSPTVGGGILAQPLASGDCHLLASASRLQNGNYSRVFFRVVTFHWGSPWEAALSRKLLQGEPPSACLLKPQPYHHLGLGDLSQVPSHVTDVPASELGGASKTPRTSFSFSGR